MFVVKSLLDCARLCAIIVNCTTFNCNIKTCTLLDIFDDNRALNKNSGCFAKSTEGLTAMSTSTQASIAFISFTICYGSSSKPEEEQSASTSYETPPSGTSFINRSTNKPSLISSNSVQTTETSNSKMFTTARSRATPPMPSTALMSPSFTKLNISSPAHSASPTTDAATNTTSLTVDTTPTTSVTSQDAFATGFTITATTTAVTENNSGHTTSSGTSPQPLRTTLSTATSTQPLRTVSTTAMPTELFTVTSTATSTHLPRTVTSTATSTQLPRTVSSTATSTPPPTTVASTATSTQLPRTVSSTATSTPPPTTVTSTAKSTHLPRTVSSTATSTQLPRTVSSTATSTPPPTTVTSTATYTQRPRTVTSTTTSTRLPRTISSAATSTPLPTTVTSTATSTQLPRTVSSTAISTPPPTTVSSTATSTSTATTGFHMSVTGFYPTLSATTIAPTSAIPTTTSTSAKSSPAVGPNFETPGTNVLTTTTPNPTSDITATTTSDDHIPPGHLRMCAYGGTFYNGSCYVFCNSQETFSSAQTNCKDNSMTTIEDKTEEMNKFLVRFLSGKSKYFVWLSGAKVGKQWVWSESNQQFTYTNWGTGQPDNMGRYHRAADCLALRTQTFQWEDLACSEKSDYACVFKWNGTTFPAISPDGKVSLLNDCGKDGGKAFNGWCYRFVHPPVIWEKAKAYCEERHMRLLELKSEKVQRFIAYFMQYMNPRNYFCVWTALQESNAGWVWQGSQKHADYTNWAKHQPDGFKSALWAQKCMCMTANGHFWRRYSCTAECQFICEYSNITATTATPTTTKELPPGQLRQCQFGGTYFLGNCYVFFHDPRTVAAAKTECHSRQMRLYEDTTVEKSTFVAQFLKTRSKGLVWIAGSDEEVEGRWVWSESLLPVSYTRWGEDQPDNGKHTDTAENCLVWDTVSSEWNDHDCQKEAGYLCEYRWNGSTFAETSPDGNVSLTGDCRQGGKEFMGRCYISAYPQASWLKAKELCEENNMRLVEIMSGRDQQFLEYYIKYIRPSGYKCVWMGLSDAVLEGHWLWKGSNEIAFYKNWAPGQPDCVDTFLTYGEDCAAIDHHDNKWHDKGCTTVMCDFVCEFNLPSAGTTTMKPLPPGILRQCKFGGIFHKGHCHVHFSKKDTYDDAETACRTHDMRLYEESSKDKTEFLVRFLSTRTKNSVWLAGSDSGSEGNWRWLESKQPFTYKNWASGEPDDEGGYFGSQDCLVSNGKWNDVSCGSTAEYVCESTWTGTTFNAHGERFNLLVDCLNGGKVYRGSCYTYSHAGVSWHKAKGICEARNMSLLESTSENEHRFVSYYLSFINPENVICLWIGLSEIQEEGRWVWESNGKPVNYTHWNTGQPSGKPHFYSSDPDCVYIKLDSNNTWHDGVCSNECPFICEQRTDNQE